MKSLFAKISAALVLAALLVAPASAQVQGRPLNSGGKPKVVWSRDYMSTVGRRPRLAFKNEPNTFYQVEVFTIDSPVRMGITDLGGRLRAKADYNRRRGSIKGHPVYMSSFSYNPQYQGQYNLRVAGRRGQRFKYRVTKYRLVGKSRRSASQTRSRRRSNHSVGRSTRTTSNQRRGRTGYPVPVVNPGRIGGAPATSVFGL